MAAPLTFLNNDSKILSLIRSEDDEGLVMLYEANRKPIRAYISRNNGTEDDADDLLQEALIVLWERVRSNRYQYTARLSTFIYATVKNMWLRRLARLRRESPAEVEEMTGRIESASALDIMIESEEANLIHKALAELGEPCKTLLILYYWEEQSMEEIAEALHLANADTAKSKKYQCKKALHQLLKQKM
ncbi:MAG: sigma-70 family RNA polymerase sigma factor [Ignavibacteriae bacterium]|nr:sigma-70 family RNA polymerase sigma factor [Ignavibacteriota bacterium]